jgi:membrane-associated protease RseP (regulator of RpoE activity)
MPRPWEKDLSRFDLSFFDRGPSRREWLTSVALFCITVISTTFAGLVYPFSNTDIFTTARNVALNPALLLYGLPYSVPLLTILLAHEMGHFLACRYYGMNCTPPFFIPLPISIAGTLGAFIRIKSQFRNKRALFDTGIAGPLAGFIFLLPALVIGIGMSHVLPKSAMQAGLFSFGEPLIFRLAGKLVLGYSPQSQAIFAHPIAMAAWFGLLATSLNLLPIWQLDGGHIAYAIFGRRVQKTMTKWLAGALLAFSLLMSSGNLFRLFGWAIPLPNFSYLFFGLLLFILGLRSNFYHPPTLEEDEKLGIGRIILGIIALAILIVSFIPVPISFS